MKVDPGKRFPKLMGSVICLDGAWCCYDTEFERERIVSMKDSLSRHYRNLTRIACCNGRFRFQGNRANTIRVLRKEVIKRIAFHVSQIGSALLAAMLNLESFSIAYGMGHDVDYFPRYLLKIMTENYGAPFSKMDSISFI
ncbi:hypothetical protein CDAR_459991 [Caerostris darwini]|uniref:Uncharacterized protein n=1 Tax=Caerostris darwini TaxID=1538125 RepID=A0AAV4QL74_9ARAC|nr:hypothetical protein CDAR_459991 [Caerostris darwini]